MEIENNLNTEKTILNNEINGKVQNNFLACPFFPPIPVLMVYHLD